MFLEAIPNENVKIGTIWDSNLVTDPHSILSKKTHSTTILDAKNRKNPNASISIFDD
jgi:hypothetical protein